MIRVAARYAEFGTTTNYSFLRGASHPEEMVAQAQAHGLSGLGIADRNSLAGVVRAHVYARQHKVADTGLRVVTGARLVLEDGTPDLLAYPRDRLAYGRLSRLLSTGNRRAEKGRCSLALADVLGFAQGLNLIALEGSTAPPPPKGRAKSPPAQHLDQLREAAAGLWIGATMLPGRDIRAALRQRVALARRASLPLLATNDVLMHAPERRPLQDILTCIREGVTLDEAGTRLEPHAERHLKPPDEMRRLFVDASEAVEATIALLDTIAFSLDELAHDYPEETRAGYPTPQAALEAFTAAGARRRYPDGVPAKIESALAHELSLIGRLDYAAYFLTVHDIVRFARGEGILCQGRGSAANSAVCFCLGITEIDPQLHTLLFERFISENRGEPPDIDVDFEHERREEVIQYIYARYGRERAALAASVITYRPRSAVREVGKVFGLSDDVVSRLSGTIWGHWSNGVDTKEVGRLGLDPAEPRLAQALHYANALLGFPRHLSQHTGGFVITRTRLDEVVPIANAAMEDRTVVEWDKNDLDALRLLKIDVLALGMLTCLAKGFGLLRDHYGQDLTLATLPKEDLAVYAMISRADTIGVFQVESRAQMSMLPRLKPQTFYDLVIEVAIVRPGPIQGDMVHPYLRRREGKEPVDYPSPELKAVLEKTLGIPLFQEQAMQIAIVAAGFSPDEADQLRRAMATFKHVGTIGSFRDKMVKGMVLNGYDRDFAERCFKQIEGFGTYGFPESHAASFALLVYASAWMKCFYPNAFACALLNSQPMGFYATSQIVRDARDHGVEVREIDVNHSGWDAALEAPDLVPAQPQRLHAHHAEMADVILARHALRLGFREVKGLRDVDLAVLVGRRGAGYDSVRDLWLRTGLSPGVLEQLAQADTFRSLGLDRREALWAVRGLNRAGDKDDLPLLRALSFTPLEPDAHLPPMPLGEHVVEDYRHLSLSLKGHPVGFVRGALRARGIRRAEELDAPALTGGRVAVAGVVLVRQRPGSAKGVIFMTIEDETGIANIIVWPKVFERLRAVVIGARLIAVTGKLQNEAGVIHVVAERIEDLSPMLRRLSAHGEGVSSLARADEVKRGIDYPPPPPRVQLTLGDLAGGPDRVIPKGRNFH